MPSKTSYPAHSRAHLSLNNLGLALGSKQVLEQVNLAVTPTSRIGIVGENGRGKTTLMHVLTGRLEAVTGTVTRKGTIGVVEKKISTVEYRNIVVADSVTIN